MGSAARMTVPLKLAEWRDHEKNRSPGMAPPPFDDIDRLERSSIFWTLYGHDTLSSLGSGWTASIAPDSVVRLFSSLHSAPFPSLACRRLM